MLQQPSSKVVPLLFNIEKPNLVSQKIDIVTTETVCSTEKKIETSVKRVKKDALWKPLLRGFRLWVRAKIQRNFDFNNFFDSTGEVRQEVFEACANFMLTLGLPERVANNQRNQMALTIMLSSTSAGKLSKYFEKSYLMKPHIFELKQSYCAVFRENSVFLRHRFFGDELIRLLWSKYIEQQSESINEYFEELRENCFGEKSFKILLQDIATLSRLVNF